MVKRRSNNEGTIYEDKEKGGYRVQLTAPDGKRISKRFKDSEEAVNWKNDKLSDFNKGQYVVPSNMTLDEWLKEWIDTYKKPKRKPRTWEAYEASFRLYLKDIKDVPIQEIVPYHITKAYNTMRKNKKSEATILKLHNALHDALNQARINKIIHVNPIDDVERPTPKKKEIVKLDEDEIMKLLKALEGTRIYAGVYLIAHTGMRLGEALGVRWKDINYEDGILTITQNLQRSKTDGLSPQTPKTENSFRSIFIDESVIEVLKAEQARQQANKDLKNSKTVVCNRNGDSLEPRRFIKEFDDVREKIGMKNVTRHALRHALASLLIDNGVPVPEVSALLGHSDQAFTFRTYVHSRKDATKKAAEATAKILKEKPKQEDPEDKPVEENTKEVDE